MIAALFVETNGAYFSLPGDFNFNGKECKMTPPDKLREAIEYLQEGLKFIPSGSYCDSINTVITHAERAKELERDLRHKTQEHEALDKAYDSLSAELERLKNPPDIEEGGINDHVPLEDAIKYWSHDIAMELRDPCGMAASSKCALALLKEIERLKKQTVTEEEHRAIKFERLSYWKEGVVGWLIDDDAYAAINRILNRQALSSTKDNGGG